MKKLLLLLTVAMMAMSLSAAPVDQAAAMRKAKSYLANELYSGKIMAPAALNPVLIKTEVGNAKINKPVYYIYNTSTTFLVIAGDDRAEEILMVGDAPLNLDRIPEGLQYLLDCYKEQIEFLHENPNIQVERPSEHRAPVLNATTYGPLLTCNWDQEAPYYNQCVFTYGGRSYQCLTGCPATSAAMVMYYWKYPESVPAMSSYSGYLNIGTNQDNYVSFTYPSLSATTFDWANMKNTYSSSSTGASATAVATLMRYVGQAEQMEYGGVNVGSGISVYDTYKIANMFKNWGYKTTARVINKDTGGYTEETWANAIIDEMAAGRPVVYCGVSSSGGHAFNVDGYNSNTNKFHVNFGWSGAGNNWFAMNAFTYSGSTFSSNQRAVIGIESPTGLGDNPVINVNPTALSFTDCNTSNTYTQTFTIGGQNLEGNVTLSVIGSTYFTVSPTTLTAAQAMAGATITVTYAPKYSGTHSSQVNISCNGAETKSVSLTGVATGGSSSGPSMTATPSALTFNTAVGTPVTQTFNLKGNGLTSIVNLAVEGAGFTIDKTTVTKSAANNGVDVTVTYNPTTSGTHTGTVTMTSTGAQPITVQLTGTATASPKLTVSPTSLSFSTTVGQPVTKTFNVTGTDLNGVVNLAVSGTGFSIDKTTITKSAATNGATVTVTYNPTAGGTHTGTVTLTSEGANPVTVSLNGAASSVPSITVNPSSLSFNTVVGTPVTKTFNVTGVNLTGVVNLAVNGTAFSIDKTTITKTAATNGATVTVTFNPTTAGNHTGTVTLTSSGAQAVTVAINGVATEPVRTITANPTALNFTALVGETKTQTFTVTGENLNGPLTLSVNGANGIYSVQPTTITAAEATAGKTVTVTYAPTTFGITNASVTISGGGAPAATVTLNGQADLVKYAPVMLPATEDYINLTEFRADWTDATPEANVASYTLEVSAKPVEPEVVELLGTIDGTSYNNQNYQVVTLSAPWSGNNVYGGYGAIYFRNATHESATTDGYIKFTVPADYQNKTFTVKLTTANSEYGSGRFVVGSTQTAAVEYNMSEGETYSWLVTGSTGDVITITSPENKYSPDIARIEVYAGNATVATLRATESGDEFYRLISGITDKFYTIENLAAEGTFLYKVKALYTDGTESDWSNIEEVTLFQNGHGYELGDVDHSGRVAITDVAALTDYLLNGNETGFCSICADVNQDGRITISDVTALIELLLNGEIATLNKAMKASLMGR